MAEFAEVMRQARRMCKAHMSCQGCPLMKENCWFVPETEVDLDETEVSERAVMHWAQEHPEPQYPLWGDWFCKKQYTLYDPIPADIAEKLGVKPKEG